MPTRKQRRRAQKERRHEYETVWVDAEGNELEEPPEESAVPAEKRNGTKPKAKAKPAQQRGGRAARVPQPPSWRRAAKRGALFGVVIFAVFAVLGSNGQHNYSAAILFGAIYTVVFIPFTFMLDRFAYNRWQRRAEQQGSKTSARKR